MRIQTKAVFRAVMRFVNFMSDHIERHMPPADAPPGFRPHATPKPYRRPGPDIGMWFTMLLGGVVVWGIVIVLLAHFW